VNAPLLFDDQLHHKLAYDGVVNPEELPKDPASVSLSNLAQTYDGGPHAVTVTTAPPGLPVDVLYDGSTTPPTNAGTYHVDAAVDHPDWAGSAQGTLVVERAPAAVVLGGLSAAYTGAPRAVTVSTIPPGLAVTVTYSGSSAPPTDPGSYAVVATVVDPNHVGAASGTLTIAVTTLVRHAPVINGRVEGSVQVLLPESATLNGGAAVTGDLLVPGTPTVRLNGSPAYGGTRDGAGSASPSSYTITLNGGARLRQVVRRTDPAALPAVPAPPRPAGTRDVVLNGPGGSVGSFATLRNLTLNGGAGTVSVPAGTYGTFIVNGSGTLVLGEAGATAPSVYNLQGLVLNGGSRLTVVGPVVINMAAGVTANASIGTAAHPEWLDLNLAAGGVTLNGGASLHGFVTAPSGAVTVNGALTGGVAADRLTVNGGGLLRVVD